MSRLKKSAAAGGIAVALIGGCEGMRQNAYPDPGTHGRPWTICMGHTDGVKPGDYKTIPECRAMLLQDADLYADRVEACTDPVYLKSMPDKRYVAFVSFAFNVGAHTYCTRIAPLVNAGRTREACDRLLAYDGITKVVAGQRIHVPLPGLVSRRKRERAFCLEGL